MAVSKEAEEVVVEDAFTEDDCPKCPPVGAPAWMSTFADMATLLMAFFVIYSFAEFNALNSNKLVVVKKCLYQIYLL